MRHRLEFWEPDHLDGQSNLDGRIFLNAAGSRMEAALGMNFRVVSAREEFDSFFLTKRRNLWHLNGSLNLNGPNILNAEIVEEEI